MRPANFELNYDHPLARGLVFAGLGNAAGSSRYHDSSPYKQHGTLVTDATWEDDAVSLDGSGGYVDCTSAHVPDGVFTLSFWAKLTDTATRRPVLSFADAYYPAVHLYWADAERPLIFLGAGNYRYMTPTATAVGSWTHFAVTVPGSGLNDIDDSAMYQNGVALAEESVYKGGPQSAKSAIRIGYISDNYRFSGLLKDVLLYDRVLSEAEILALANPANTMLSGMLKEPGSIGDIYNLEGVR